MKTKWSEKFGLFDCTGKEVRQGTVLLHKSSKYSVVNIVMKSKIFNGKWLHKLSKIILYDEFDNVLVTKKKLTKRYRVFIPSSESISKTPLISALLNERDMTNDAFFQNLPKE